MQIGEMFNAIGYLEQRSGIRETGIECYFCPDLYNNEMVMRTDIKGETIIEKFDLMKFMKTLSDQVWLERKIEEYQDRIATKK